jgi:hypothetical protein
MADEIDVDVLVGRPMALEIVEKLLPVGWEIVKLKVPQRKRKAVVDADQSGNILGQFLLLAIRRRRAASSTCAGMAAATPLPAAYRPRP